MRPFGGSEREEEDPPPLTSRPEDELEFSSLSSSSVNSATDARGRWGMVLFVLDVMFLFLLSGYIAVFEGCGTALAIRYMMAVWCRCRFRFLQWVMDGEVVCIRG